MLGVELMFSLQISHNVNDEEASINTQNSIPWNIGGDSRAIISLWTREGLMDVFGKDSARASFDKVFHKGRHVCMRNDLQGSRSGPSGVILSSGHKSI